MEKIENKESVKKIYVKGSGTGRGGWRGGGRPKGSTSSKPKSKKTFYFTKALTQEEKIYLEKCLVEYRERTN